MKQNIVIRALQKDDIPALENIIKKTWNYEKFATPKTAKRLSEVFFASCLTNQTFSRVAQVDGETVGVILGKNIDKHHCPLSYRFHQLWAIYKLISTKEGRLIFNFFKDINDIDEQLRKQCPNNYKGELSLFAISSSYRGCGIGKKLFNTFIDYMKDEHINDFYLYTDTSCNFGFYEHQGMIKRQSYQKNIQMQGQEATLEFYLYDMIVDKNT